MNRFEKQALHHLTEDLCNHAFITERILRHYTSEGYITKAEKYDLSRMGSNAEKVKRILQILKNKKVPMGTIVQGLVIESKNQWVNQKINKKVDILRKRQQKQENKEHKSYFRQLDDIAEILYVRGHGTVFGKPVKVAHNTIHETLVEDFNGLVGQIEECREKLSGDHERPLTEIIEDYKQHRDQEVADARLLCTKMVKSKNNDLEKKSKEIRSLKEELAKTKAENERLRKTMDEEIKQKTQEGVRKRLLSFQNTPTNPRLSTENKFTLKPLNLSSEKRQPTESVDRTNDIESDDGSEDAEDLDTKVSESVDAKGLRVTNNYNIYNNYLYSNKSKLYQN